LFGWRLVMWRSVRKLAPVVTIALLVGCEQTSAPTRRDIQGNWELKGVPGTTASMTLAEVARVVDGAGTWIDGSGPFAYIAFGALAGNGVTLYFDFSEREDFGFQGRFVTSDSISGSLVGGGFQNVPASFTQVD
jgi:hypothetical protein